MILPELKLRPVLLQLAVQRGLSDPQKFCRHEFVAIQAGDRSLDRMLLEVRQGDDLLFDREIAGQFCRRACD